MFEWVKVENFRCFPKLEVPLRPLTVLVGLNDTGKSSFLGALDAVWRPADVTPFDHWELNLFNTITIELSGPTGEISLVALGGPVKIDGVLRHRPYQPRSQGITEPAEARVAMFDFPAGGPMMTSPGYADIGASPALQSHGEGVPAFLDYLLRRERRRFDDFVGAMREHVPGLRDINVATPDPQTRRIVLKIESGLELPADRASVGVRLMVFFMALTYHPTPPGLILIEEPENGVHPHRLKEIMALLRGISKGEHCGHPAQVILTTHSPYLLDHVNLDEDEVLVFRRNDDGSRTAEPADAQRLKAFLDEFMLGEVWFNQGEEGLVKREG
jgi:predicted ATPase